MAAYAALVSVRHIIDHIEHHPLLPISLENKQLESLTKNVTFLQEFLESYPHIGENEQGRAIESRIADAAFAAEDVIESHVVDEILVESTNRGQNTGLFCQRLQKVIEDMEHLIKKEVMEIKEKMGVRVQHHQLQRRSASHSSGHNTTNTVVGFDEALLEILGKLVGEEDGREIISITGMGGIGKTTLARNVYEHPLIKEHFDIRSWVTISQEHNTRNILNEVLCQAKQVSEVSSGMNEHDIGGDVHKNLCGRKYLIIMDDMWSIEAWDKIKFFFPDYKNGSRIVVTTRLANLARNLTNCRGLDMKLLGMDESWDLFSKIVFAEEGSCPPELEEIGKKIVANCRGLPLSIAVIGGFLAKSDCKREHWEHVEENLNSIVNSQNDEDCLKILQLSYNQLPVHLKPCFLYMGVFKEDSATRISKLVKLWVAEGFLKPIKGKVLEEVGKQYLKDLVDRNLVSITTTGRGKCVKIHDLLRDLCWRQAQTERFYSVVGYKRSVDAQSRRFIISDQISVEEEDAYADALRSSIPFARSMITYYKNSTNLPPEFRLLRIFGACDDLLSFDEKSKLVNLRYLATRRCYLNSELGASFHLLWNLQTLTIQKNNYRPYFEEDSDSSTAPAEIWTMPQLRHVIMAEGYLHLPDPPACKKQDDDIVLENLQTLMTVRDFKCSQEVVKRIPNIKKLWILYVDEEVGETHLNNLERLNKLKSFQCISYRDGSDSYLQSLTFPDSLKKLTLNASHVHWEDMLAKIGSLPLLQKLEIECGCFRTGIWETVEGHFSSLKLLVIRECGGLKEWSSESSHFPRLEQLVLDGLGELNEIPLDIGEIATMQSIKVNHCSRSAVVSAKRILEEQEELYGEEEVGLRVQVRLFYGDEDALQGFASPDIEIRFDIETEDY